MGNSSGSCPKERASTCENGETQSETPYHSLKEGERGKKTYNSEETQDSLQTSRSFKSFSPSKSGGKLKSKSYNSNSNSTMSKALAVKSMASVSHPLLDYTIDRQGIDKAINILQEYEFDIIGVWLVSRPINHVAKGKFKHWSIKIHAVDILVTVDFFEKNGAGAFGVHLTTTAWKPLDAFLYYYKRDDKQKKWKPHSWVVESCVVPKLLEREILENDLTMPSEMTDTMLEEEELKDAGKRNVKLVEHILCGKKVSDIAKFLTQWNAKHASYNAFDCNCQRFAYDLYFFLVGAHYPAHVKSVAMKLQSWSDYLEEKKKWDAFGEIEATDIECAVSSDQSLESDSTVEADPLS